MILSSTNLYSEGTHKQMHTYLYMHTYIRPPPIYTGKVHTTPLPRPAYPYLSLHTYIYPSCRRSSTFYLAPTLIYLLWEGREGATVLTSCVRSCSMLPSLLYAFPSPPGMVYFLSPVIGHHHYCCSLYMSRPSFTQ